VHLSRGASGVEGEHHPVAAQHHVVGLVGLGDVLQVEHLSPHVGNAPRHGPLTGDVDHDGNHVGDHDLAAGPDLPGRGQPGAPGPGGELEHPVAGVNGDLVEHALGDGRRPLVDVVGAGAPGGCHAGPHPMDEGPDLLARSGVCHAGSFTQIDYSLRVLNSLLELSSG
jgi:hypothetical protein